MPHPVYTYILTLCGGDENQTARVLDWITTVHNGIKPNQCLVLCGPHGCGKGIFVQMFMRAMLDLHQGAIYETTVLPRVINDEMELASLVHFKEPDLYRLLPKLKVLISASVIKWRSPEFDYAQRIIPNNRAYIITTNTRPNPSVVMDRRILYIECRPMDAMTDAVSGMMRDGHSGKGPMIRSYLKNRARWGRVRHKLRLRAIVLYWLDLTKTLMQPGGVAFERDLFEFEKWVEGAVG